MNDDETQVRVLEHERLGKVAEFFTKAAERNPKYAPELSEMADAFNALAPLDAEGAAEAFLRGGRAFERLARIAKNEPAIKNLLVESEKKQQQLDAEFRENHPALYILREQMMERLEQGLKAPGLR